MNDQTGIQQYRSKSNQSCELSILKGLDATKDKQPHFRYKCKCSLCLKNFDSKVVDKKFSQYTPKEYQLPPYLSDPQVKQINETDFMFICQRLTQPITKKKTERTTLRLLIPETCFFLDGEPKFIIHSVQDKNLDCKQIQLLKQRDNLKILKIRKFLNDCRRQKMAPSCTSQHVIKIESDIKILQSKRGVSFNKFGNVLNPKMVRIKLQKDLKQLKMQEILAEKMFKEAILCKYNDQNVQVLSDLEFLNYSIKTKDDPFWQKVSYLQNYIQTAKVPYQILKIEFKYQKDNHTRLFKKAKIEIQIINGEISHLSEDYIDLDEEIAYEDILKSQNEIEYLKYQLYKIVHFIETFHNLRITQGWFEFIKDDHWRYHLINTCQVQDIKHQQIKSHFLTNEKFFKKLEQNAQDALLLSPIPQDQILKAHLNKNIKEIQSLMDGNFETSLKNVGLPTYVELSEKEGISDDAFTFLHPSSPAKLSSLLKGSIPLVELKKQFIWTNGRSSRLNQSMNKMYDIFSSPDVNRYQKQNALAYKSFQDCGNMFLKNSSRNSSVPHKNSFPQTDKDEFLATFYRRQISTSPQQTKNSLTYYLGLNN